MLYAFILSTLTLLARDGKVTGFLEADMVSFPGGKCQMYRLYLKDKDLDHTPFSVNRPSEFLSQRSIDRRKRQGIPVDLTDLPVAPAYEKQVAEAGIEVVEARITYLAYAPESAAVMLQRQQASAIIDARKMIVDGAVGMVEMALDRLSENKVVELDDERKAAMVSNLLVVLCGNRDAQPIVNSGSLY